MSKGKNYASKIGSFVIRDGEEDDACIECPQIFCSTCPYCKLQFCSKHFLAHTKCKKKPTATSTWDDFSADITISKRRRNAVGRGAEDNGVGTNKNKKTGIEVASFVQAGDEEGSNQAGDEAGGNLSSIIEHQLSDRPRELDGNSSIGRGVNEISCSIDIGETEKVIEQDHFDDSQESTAGSDVATTPAESDYARAQPVDAGIAAFIANLSVTVKILEELVKYYDDDIILEAVLIRNGDLDKVDQLSAELATVYEQCGDPGVDGFHTSMSYCKRLRDIFELPNLSHRLHYPIDNQYVDSTNNKLIPPENWLEAGLEFIGYPLVITEQYVYFDRYIIEQKSLLWIDKSIAGENRYILVWNSDGIYDLSCERIKLNLNPEEIKGDIDTFCRLVRRYKSSSDPVSLNSSEVINITGDSIHGTVRNEVGHDEEKSQALPLPGDKKNIEGGTSSITQNGEENILDDCANNEVGDVQFSEAAKTVPTNATNDKHTQVLCIGLHPDYELDRTRVKGWTEGSKDFSITTGSGTAYHAKADNQTPENWKQHLQMNTCNSLPSLIDICRPRILVLDYMDWDSSKPKEKFGGSLFEQIHEAIRVEKIKWAIVPNFREKGNRSLLVSVKKYIAVYNAANANRKLQIMPLTFMEAASRLFYLHKELKSTVKVENKILADYCFKEVTKNLNKEFPFLCIGLDSRDFVADQFFLKQQLPVTGAFTRPYLIADGGLECFIPTAQLDIEQTLVRTMLPLWQKPMDPLEINICARKFKVSSFHFVDPRNNDLKFGKSANERSNLDYIEPEYSFKDKLLRFQLLSAKCFQVHYEKSNILGLRSADPVKTSVSRCIFRLGALYAFDYSAQKEKCLERTLVAIKRSRCSEPLELCIIYNHRDAMVEEKMMTLEEFKSSGYYVKIDHCFTREELKFLEEATFQYFDRRSEIYNRKYGVEYDTHMDIEANGIRSDAFRKNYPPITDESKLEEKEKQWEIATGLRSIVNVDTTFRGRTTQSQQNKSSSTSTQRVDKSTPPLDLPGKSKSSKLTLSAPKLTRATKKRCISNYIDYGDDFFNYQNPDESTSSGDEKNVISKQQKSKVTTGTVNAVAKNSQGNVSLPSENPGASNVHSNTQGGYIQASSSSKNGNSFNQAVNANIQGSSSLQTVTSGTGGSSSHQTVDFNGQMIDSMASITMKDMSAIFMTKSQVEKQEYYINHYQHTRLMQEEDQAYALADKKFKNKIMLAARAEELAQFERTKLLADAHTNIHEKRLIGEADNAHAVSNARSRDIIRTLDTSYSEHRIDREYCDKSRRSSYSSHAFRSESSKTHSFTYQDEIASFSLEEQRAEHAIKMAKKRNELVNLTNVKQDKNNGTSIDLTTPQNTSEKTQSLNTDSRGHSPSNNSSRRRMADSHSPSSQRGEHSSGDQRRASRSRSPTGRHGQCSTSDRRRRSRCRSPSRRGDYTTSDRRRRSRSRSPIGRRGKHNSASGDRRRRSRSRSPIGRRGEHNSASGDRRRRSRSRSPIGRRGEHNSASGDRRRRSRSRSPIGRHGDYISSNRRRCSRSPSPTTNRLDERSASGDRRRRSRSHNPIGRSGKHSSSSIRQR